MTDPAGARTAPPWLVLFDIDGTLLKCGPQIRDIFQSSLEEAYGRGVRLDGYSFAGRTDHGIVHDLLAAAGLDEEAVEERIEIFERLYLARLEERLDASLMTLLPGVAELLQALAGRHDVLLGLLTGNLERGARIKLSRVGIDGYFPFGAFGDRVARRSDLPPLALERARAAHGAAIERSRVVIVGDSVLDVRCALDNGLRCLAVTTGFTSREELLGAGARWVADDLRAARLAEALAAPEPRAQR